MSNTYAKLFMIDWCLTGFLWACVFLFLISKVIHPLWYQLWYYYLWSSSNNIEASFQSVNHHEYAYQKTPTNNKHQTSTYVYTITINSFRYTQRANIKTYNITNRRITNHFIRHQSKLFHFWFERYRRMCV